MRRGPRSVTGIVRTGVSPARPPDALTGTSLRHPASGVRALQGRTGARLRRLLVFAAAGVFPIASCSSPPARVAVSTPPCAGSQGVGAAVPAGRRAGDLVSAVDLTPGASTSPGFPTRARVWRMLYVSTGVDENDLQLVCGLVAAPVAGPKILGGTGRLLDWAHGTVGVAQGCLPASDPADLFWAAMPGGINAVAWGPYPGAHTGPAAGGLLQYAMNQGMVVTAADYQPDDTYAVGKIEASDVLDAARAGTQLMAEEFPAAAPAAYDTFIWGHSQGAQAALFAGQLAEGYFAATTPSKPTAMLHLVGVAALAPVANFIAVAGQPGVAPGDGLADWAMHQNVGLDLPIQTLQLQIGPALFAYIFGSWVRLSAGPAPAAKAKFPAFPAGATRLDLHAILTPVTGIATVNTVAPMCLTGAAAKQIQHDVGVYSDAKTYQMLVPMLWNLPATYQPGQYFKGGLDKTCQTTTDTGIARWCAWLRWNQPGPLGANPFPKAPMVGGKPIPLLIAQGSDDNVVHCVAPSGLATTAVPGPADCMSTALFNALSAGIYCPAGTALGHLQFDTMRQVAPQSPASHFSIAGEMSAKALTNSPSDLVFVGSPLERFMTSTFSRTATPGCSTQVLNP